MMNIQVDVQVLARATIFSDLASNQEAMKALASVMSVKRFSSGAHIIREGMSGEETYVIIQGTASIFRNTAEGDNYKVAIVSDQNTPVLGEGGLVQAESRSATVVAESDCVCLVLTRTAFDLFAKEHPEWALPILKRIAVTLMTRLKNTSHDLMLLHRALMHEIRG